MHKLFKKYGITEREMKTIMDKSKPHTRTRTLGTRICVYISFFLSPFFYTHNGCGTFFNVTHLKCFKSTIIPMI